MAWRKPVKTERKLHNQKSQQAVINGPYIFKMPSPLWPTICCSRSPHTATMYGVRASHTDGNGQNKSPEPKDASSCMCTERNWTALQKLLIQMSLPIELACQKVKEDNSSSFYIAISHSVIC